jgi:hypothetical protein
MIIECDACAMRDLACADCVVTVLLRSAPTAGAVELDGTEQQALAVLAGSGLVPPLRLVHQDHRAGRVPAEDPRGHSQTG